MKYVIITFLIVTLWTCQNAQNPYKQAENTSLHFSEFASTVAVGDSLPIFSTRRLQFDVYLPHLVDSIKVVSTDNWLWSEGSKLFTAQSFAGGTLSFDVSFAMPKKVTVQLTGYVQGGSDTLTNSVAFHVYSPLYAENVVVNSAEEVVLQSAKLDDDVLYVWELSDGTVLNNDAPQVQYQPEQSQVGTTINGTFYARKGLFAKSPTYPFIVSVQDALGPSIKINDPNISNGVVVTGAVSYYLYVSATDPSGVAQLLVNEEELTDCQTDNDSLSCVSIIDSLKNYSEDTLHLDISAKDNEGNVSTRRLSVLYDSTRVVKLPLQISLTAPAEDTSYTTVRATTFRGSISGKLSSEAVYILPFVNSVYADTTIAVDAVEQQILLPLALPEDTNEVELFVSSFSNQELLDTLLHLRRIVIYNTASIDSTPPIISNVQIDGKNSKDKNFVTTATPAIQVLAYDIHSAVVAVIADGDTMQAQGQDVFTAQLEVTHNPDMDTVVVEAIDENGLSSQKTILVTWNNPPRLTRVPEKFQAQVSAELRDTIAWADQDEDEVTATLELQLADRDTFLVVDESGHFSFTPTISDTGDIRVAVLLSDGFEKTTYTYTLTIVQQAAMDTARFTTKPEDFPDTLVVDGEPLRDTLRIDKDPAQGLYQFKVAIQPLDTVLINTVRDSIVSWMPSSQAIGSQTMMAVVFSNGIATDTLQKTFTVVPPPIDTTIQFTLSASEMYENAQACSLVVELSEPAAQTKAIYFSINNAETTLDENEYQLITESPLLVSSSQTTATIIIALNDDEIREQKEKLVVNLLQNPAGLIPRGTIAHTCFILDDDTLETIPMLGFAVASDTVSEGDAQIQIPLTLSEASSESVSVNITLSGNAQSGSDYSLQTPSIGFSPQQTTQNILLTILDDQVCESSFEHIIIGLNAVVGADLAEQDSTMLVIRPSDLQECESTVLYLAANSSPIGYDKQIVEKLQASDFSVTVANEQSFSSDLLSGQDVVYISSSFSSEQVLETIMEHPVALVISNSFLAIEAGITASDEIHTDYASEYNVINKKIGDELLVRDFTASTVTVYSSWPRMELLKPVANSVVGYGRIAQRGRDPFASVYGTQIQNSGRRIAYMESTSIQAVARNDQWHSILLKVMQWVLQEQEGL